MAVATETRTPEAIRTALEDLARSDGWQLLREMVDEQFGPAANLQQIDQAMTQLRPGDDELAVVTQIRAASKAAYAVLSLADSKLRHVTQATKPRIADRFAGLRRMPR